MKNKKEFMWFCIPSDFIIDRKQLVKVITKIGKPHKFKDPVSLLTYLDLSGNSRNRLYYIQHKGNLFHTYIATRRVLIGREELRGLACNVAGFIRKGAEYNLRVPAVVLEVPLCAVQPYFLYPTY